MRFILASGSSSRRRILTDAAVPFLAMPADVDEEALKDAAIANGMVPADIALHLAQAKALHVSAAHPDALVLGSDQTLLLGAELISKCPDLQAARVLLSRLRGREHLLVGGMVLARAGAVLWRHVATSRLSMRMFSDGFLDDYLAREGEGVLSAVGCYKLEGVGAQLFDSIDGDYFAILGLTLQPLLAELRKQGVLPS